MKPFNNWHFDKRDFRDVAVISFAGAFAAFFVANVLIATFS